MKKFGKHEIIRFLEELKNWQKETFPESTYISMIAHLEDEVQELFHELTTDPRTIKVKLEYADCFLLLVGSAMRYGMDLDAIVQVMMDKFEIVKRRKWVNSDKKGVYKHVKE